jgi:hypothetical protein
MRPTPNMIRQGCDEGVLLVSGLRLVAVILALASVCALASTWETSAFRTSSGKLVTPGMTMTEVLRDAGEPVRRTKVSEGISIDGRIGESVEVWTYRGGDGLYDVTFRGTKVIKIEVTPNR